MLLAPLAAARGNETVQDITARVDTEVPETATRVMVLYRLSNGFAQPGGRAESLSPAFDGRFDVQVRQSLPFMNFSNARWEMLLAVRNFFRDASCDQSLYDELLVDPAPQARRRRRHPALLTADPSGPSRLRPIFRIIEPKNRRVTVLGQNCPEIRATASTDSHTM